MNTGFIATQSVTINALAAKVWKALTDPTIVKQYLFGTEVTTDWKVGNPITYKGVWKGKAYEDKGTIINVVPERLIESTYWSGMSGLADVPENYKKVVYKLTPAEKGTTLTVIQDNNATEEEKNHSEENWKVVLTALKELLEKQ
ncbi:MAG: SRPBCC domain-containing protein [Bacteroidota bacterium]|nr:SRPBCC domain-containing protein [Bacteroidota bacterium]